MMIVFYLSGAVAIVSTFLAISQKQAVRALLYLIVSFFAVAVIFLTFGAAFAAALEVITYAGAIMVLFVFVIMMLNQGATTIRQEREWIKPEMWLGPSLLGIVLLGEVIYALAQVSPISVAPGSGAGVSPRAVGTALFSVYALAVELASFLLLAGLVGAYYLGRHEISAPSALERAESGELEGGEEVGLAGLTRKRAGIPVKKGEAR